MGPTQTHDLRKEREMHEEQEQIQELKKTTITTITNTRRNIRFLETKVRMLAILPIPRLILKIPKCPKYKNDEKMITRPKLAIIIVRNVLHEKPEECKETNT